MINNVNSTKKRPYMNIVYLIYGTYSVGGIERVLCNKTNWLVKHGYDVTIITTDQRGRSPFFDFDPAIRMVDLGIDFMETNGSSFFRKSFRYFEKQSQYRAKLSRFLTENPADMVISMFGTEVHWLPKLRDGSKKVAEIHFSKFFRMQQARGGLWWLSDWIRSRADEKAIRKYDRFVVLTHEDKAYWGNKPNMTVIPNATSFIPDRPAPLTRKQAIAAGRLGHQKGFERLIAAWEIARRTHPDWALSIFGGGEDRETLAEQIRAAGLQGVITLHAPTTDIADRYRESSLYVLSSRYEGLPMVLLESMACGVPAVAFACKCGPRDVIEPEVNGLLVEEGDIEALARSIIRLIEDEPLRRQLGHNARRTIETRFTEPVVMQQWVELFESLKV